MFREEREGGNRDVTLGADKAYDSTDFVEVAGKLNVSLHVTKNDNGHRLNLSQRTTRHAGYTIHLCSRWLVSECDQENQ